MGVGMGDWGRSMRFCLQYWTRFPLMGAELYLQPADFRRSMVFLPLIGGLTGLLMAGLAYLGSLTSSMLVAAAFAVIGGMAFTGGIYLDGVADLADASAYRDRRRKLQSMGHKRVEGRGVMAIVLDVALQVVLYYGLIDSIELMETFRYLPVAAIMGNYAIVLVAFLCRSIAVDDADYRFIEGTRGREVLLATAMTLLMLFFILGWKNMLWVFFLPVLPCVPFALLWNRRMGGINRDVLGMAHELAVCIALFCMLYFVFGKWN